MKTFSALIFAVAACAAFASATPMNAHHNIIARANGMGSQDMGSQGSQQMSGQQGSQQMGSQQGGQDPINSLEMPNPNTVPTTPVQCFAAIDEAVKYLQESQAGSDQSAPPDFSKAEIGLTRLSMLLRQCTKVIENGNFLTAQDSKYVGQSLLDMRIRIEGVCDTIKASKKYSDEYGYTPFIIQILEMLVTQIYNLDQALAKKTAGETPEKLPSIMTDIVCTMSQTIKFLGGQSPIDDSVCSKCTCKSWDAYGKSCVKPMPKPKPCKPIQQCGCAATAMKTMYEQQSWGSQGQICSGGNMPEPEPTYHPKKLWWHTCKEKHSQQQRRDL